MRITKFFQFPWVLRADKEERLRLLAEKKCEEVKKDTETVERMKNTVSREFGLNDWTATAKIFFTGKES